MKPLVTKRIEAALSTVVSERMMIVSTWMSGKRGTRRDTMPRKRVTVCAGTSCEKATRNEICRGMLPLMLVKLTISLANCNEKVWCK